MLEQLILDLYEYDMIKFGEFTLKSGKKSYIYADIRTAIAYPRLFRDICDVIYAKIKHLEFDSICGVPYSALTFASGICYEHSIPQLLKRKEAKEYGTKKILEGKTTVGDTCLLVEDVITTGASLLETTKVIEHEGIKVRDICTLINREQGGVDKLQEYGYNVISVMTLRDIIHTLYKNKKIDQQQQLAALACIEV